MKDSVLFEHVLAELLDCRDEDLEERDQREEILSRLVQLQIEKDSGDGEIAQLHDLACARIRKLEAIKQGAKNLLGAGDDATWKRFKQQLVDAIAADTTFPESNLNVAAVPAERLRA